MTGPAVAVALSPVVGAVSVHIAPFHGSETSPGPILDNAENTALADWHSLPPTCTASAPGAGPSSLSTSASSNPVGTPIGC